MQVVYYKEEVPETINKSLFLAGPSLRPEQRSDQESWRKAALQILEDKGFDGVVFVPENRDGDFDDKHDYETTVKWEETCLNVADCIVFWIPRDLESLPGFTTNDEFGFWKSSGKVVLGAPSEAAKVKYQKYYAVQYNIPFSNQLAETLQNAIDHVGEGVKRTGGERYVPLYIWRTETFQHWYKAQIKAGNRLDWARLLYNFRPRNKSFVFLWVLHVHVYVAAEDRVKSNELVLSRTNVSTVCMYYDGPTPLPDEEVFGVLPKLDLPEIEVVLIKEFRSPSATEDAYIRELPGGSSTKDRDPLLVAVEEISEETGFDINPNRLKEIGIRQLAGTLSAHTSTLYAVRLSEKEINWFKNRKGEVHGNVEDSERCYIEVVTIKELLENNLVDWSTLGQILSAVGNNAY